MKPLRVAIGSMQLFLGDADRGQNKPKIGLARFEDRDVRVYAKRMSPDKVAAELYGALLAQLAGFSCPQPGLAWDDKSKKWWFTSEAQKSPDLSRRFAVEDTVGPAQTHAVWRAFEWLSEKPGFPALVAWDEWANNRDRNLQNILVDGDGFGIIDHDQAFNCHDPELADVNKMAQAVNARLAPAAQLRVKAGAVAGALSFSSQWADKVYDALSPVPPAAAANLGTIRTWMASRYPYTAQNVERRLHAGQSNLPI